MLEQEIDIEKFWKDEEKLRERKEQEEAQIKIALFVCLTELLKEKKEHKKINGLYEF